MAQVKKGYYPGKSWSELTFKTFIDALNCPFVETSHEGNITTVNVNNVVSIIFNMGYGRVQVVYNEQTLVTYGILNGNNDFYITAACNDNFFYVQTNCDYQSGRRFVFLYENINNKDYFGYNGSENVGGRGWFSIQEITLTETSSSLTYNHSSTFNYACAAGYIDYASPDCLFSAGYKTDVEDVNFISSSTVTLDQAITIAGKNYYAIGTNILVELDS